MRIKNLIEGLNAQQRSVPQLPAQARAKKISVLGAKTDPRHPFAGYMVGADESAEPGKKRIGPDPTDPYEKGWRAGFRHNESNPYPAGSKEAQQWDDGYAEAEAQPNHYDESAESDMPDLEEVGEPVESIMDAERRMAAGDRIFVAHEMDEEPFEIHNVGDLKGYTYDQMLAVPQDVSEDLDEAVGGNYLYHATNSLKDILASGQINKSDFQKQQDATRAQTTLPTFSVTRDWNYAVGGKGTGQVTGTIGRSAIIVLDRNAVESNFRTLGTSQTSDKLDLRGTPHPGNTAFAYDVIKKQPDDAYGKKMIAGRKKMATPDNTIAPKNKIGQEFEEVVVVPKGSMPIKGTMVGFYIPPSSPLMKDPAVMNDPRRLDLEKGGTGRFVKAAQQPAQQAVAETTGDPKFDKMIKGITGKKAVAKQQKTDTKQQSRDAFGSMFGGTSADLTSKLKIREQGVAEACWKGYHKEGNKELFGKRVPNCVKNEGAERNELDTPAVQAALAKMAERHRGEKWSKEQLAALGKRIAARGQKPIKEDITKEDVISKLKAKLSDYLSDLSKEIKTDPDLKDKLAAKSPGDQMGPPVKTVTTDDGHEIQIHGNEDDGFRISIKNKPAASRFKNLDEAVMACEMYCARRRTRTESADYVEEAGKDACYNKVKSRYKIWPSAYASGALVRCRKVGAANWGNKSKK